MRDPSRGELASIKLITSLPTKQPINRSKINWMMAPILFSLAAMVPSLTIMVILWIGVLSHKMESMISSRITLGEKESRVGQPQIIWIYILQEKVRLLDQEYIRAIHSFHQTFKLIHCFRTMVKTRSLTLCMLIINTKDLALLAVLQLNMDTATIN